MEDRCRLKDAAARRNLAFVRDLLTRSRCADCGLSDIVVLEFDHVRGHKAANVTRLANGGFALSRIRDEIAKCEIRCANCHRRRTLTQAYGFLRAVS